MDTTDFARSLFMLTNDVPITNLFDKDFGQKEDRWWGDNHLEHFRTWALHQDTYGVGEYHHEPNEDASLMYSNIARPEMLLWLIESLQISLKRLPTESQSKLEIDLDMFGTFVESLKSTNNCRSQCAKIRRKYPFTSIEKWLKEHRKLEEIYLTEEELKKGNEFRQEKDLQGTLQEVQD